MIGTACERGHRLRGLVEYLYGPGRWEEHTNPHLVAAWDPNLIEAPRDKHARGELCAQMRAPRELFGVEVPGGPVYHVVCSIGADERQLSDAEWRAVAERAADKLGFTAREGRAGCRWIAVHHGLSKTGNDHIHFVVEPVREDGTLAEVGGDWFALGEMCTEMEHELGLKVLTRKPRGERWQRSLTGVQGATRAELAAAQRHGRPEPDRTALARRVNAAASSARTEAEWLIRMRQDGLLVLPRWAAGQRAGQRLEQVVGYSVALRPPVGQKPVWYGGGRLGRELSLPALRQRWPDPTGEQVAEALGQWRPKRWRREPAARIPRPRRLHPRAWEVAGAQVAATRRRLAEIPAGDHDAWASSAREASGNLAALAQRLQPGQRAQLARAADALARAGQVPNGNPRGHRDPATDALSGVSRVITDAMLAGHGGAAATTMLVRQIVELALEIARVHRATARAAEAHAARAAAEYALAYVHAVSSPIPAVPVIRGEQRAPEQPRAVDRARVQPERRPARSTPPVWPYRARPPQRGRDDRGRG